MYLYMEDICVINDSVNYWVSQKNAISMMIKTKPRSYPKISFSNLSHPSLIYIVNENAENHISLCK